ncbi:MAG TPA: C1 family peptidase [Candidatus Saccharimonadales bacterium]|nr:C1 family peptidase [Candidatus Saccharimonadales bacterium]
MFDDTIRVTFLILVGLALTVAMIWYLGFLHREIRGTGQVVIDPFTVIDPSGKPNDELGKALAQLLQAHLQSLVRELGDAQAGFTKDVQTPAMVQGAPAGQVGDVRLWTQPVALHADLFQPINLKLSVGGVDVGGILPWLQQRLSSRRTLHFTLCPQAGQAQVLGSLDALKLPDAAVRLSVKGSDGNAPTPDAVVDALAHEIVHRYLARDTTNRLEILDPEEFTSLADVLVSVAQANRKSLRGRPAQGEYAALIPAITALADKVPDWPELVYLAARIADSGKDSLKALTYYRRVQPNLQDPKQRELAAWVTARIADLSPSAPPAGAAQLAVAGEPLPPALDYSGAIKSVRDSGPEGSVVGLALATALEFQIAKETKRPEKVSARYIYYAARKVAGGSLEEDSGARIEDGLTALSRMGAVAEDVWPYKPGEYAKEPPAAVEKAERFHITDIRSLTTLDDLKFALKQHGPVVAGISIHQSAMTKAVSKTGVLPLPKPTERVVGGHAVVIVGYNDATRQLKFVNSWGRDWGEHGFGYLPYDYVDKSLFEAWTFTLAKT